MPGTAPREGSLAGSVARLGLVSGRSLRRAEAEAERSGRTVEAVLVDDGALSPDQLLVAARHRWTEDHVGAAGAAAVPAGPLFGFPSGLRVLLRRARMARTTRILATALVTASAVLATELAVTVLWGEPLSAFFAARSQAQVSRELDALEERFAAEAAQVRAEVGVATHAARRREASAAARAERRRIAGFGTSLTDGGAFGRIEIPAIGASAAVVEGTGPGSLAKGPGHFPGTALPGQGDTVAIAGHRTTYLAPFRRISDLAVGDRIAIAMPYGRYSYEVTGARVVPPDDSWVVGPRASERLVLTSCHPLFSAAERYVVFARPTRA